MKSFCFAVILLAAATPEQIRNMVADLGAEKHATREAAHKALMEVGESAEPFVAAAAGSKDPEVRTRARQILAWIGAGNIDDPDPAILKEVDELLDPVMGSSHANLDVLVQMGKRATPALVAIAKRDAFSNSNNRKAIYGMIALTRATDPRAFRTLANLFQSGISIHMSGYVGQMKNPEMLRELIKAWVRLGDEASEKLREQVKKMSGQNLGDDPSAYLKWYEKEHPATKPD